MFEETSDGVVCFLDLDARKREIKNECVGIVLVKRSMPYSCCGNQIGIRLSHITHCRNAGPLPPPPSVHTH